MNAILKFLIFSYKMKCIFKCILNVNAQNKSKSIIITNQRIK